MFFLFLTVFIMSILTGAEIDLYTPSFPELQEVFHLTPFMVEATLTVNLAAHCFTALIAGNLGDRYGRRSIILLGLIIFMIGTLFCIFAPNFSTLLLGRLLQGIGISGPAVLAFLVLADKHSTEKQQSILGVLNGTVTLSMATAPIIGSYINKFFGWQGNFVALLGLAVMGFLCSIIFIPKAQQAKQNIKFSFREYLPLLRSQKALLYLFTICMLCQPYWIFIGISPILYMESLGVSLEQFGFYQGSLCLIFALVSIFSSYLLAKFGQKKCFDFSIYLLFLFLVFGTSLVLFDVQNPLTITLVLLLLAAGAAFPINILWPLAINVMPNAKGRMTALLISSRLIITSCSLQIVGYLYRGSFFEVGIIMLSTLVLSLLFCYRLFALDNPFKKTPDLATELST